ncbi:MAG: glycosyltransferase, partial [Clostridium saudiense]|nr:glycosyltransferase [Clostridium saudiense]
MNKEEISVSIICATYNHEKYLKYALNSILNQKTTFKFEVLVGEDCSTDDSRKILKYYEEKYPNFFTIFYRKKNFGPIKNFIDLYYRAKGKYLVVLETDDFWIDELKLQKSFDFLESNNDYIAVSHRCIIVDENNNSIGKQYPECHKSEYSYDEYMKDLLPGQTTTVMFRNFFLKELNYSIELLTEDKYCIGPGDARKAFTFIVNGKVACLPDVMSAYRLVTSGGSSYSANVKR